MYDLPYKVTFKTYVMVRGFLIDVDLITYLVGIPTLSCAIIDWVFDAGAEDSLTTALAQTPDHIELNLVFFIYQQRPSS